MDFAQSFQKLAPDLQLGGRYRVVRRLGVGGFSETFLAKDMQLPGQPDCVIKQLKPQSRNLERWQVAKRLFDTEAAVLYRLGSHERIPRLFAHFEDNQNFYLVQEFIPGVSLRRKLVAEQPWPEARVIVFLQDMLQTLVYVHQQNVIHRDIKPSNLICRQADGRIVLIDFGAVKQVSVPAVDALIEHSITIAIGTQGYMPMEQFSGTPRFNSDIYAVGMIGIEALTGLRPNQLQRDLHSGEILWREHVNSTVSPALAECLDQMVRCHFKERYQTAQEALQAVEALLEQRSDIVPDIEFAALTELGSSEPSDSEIEDLLQALPDASPLPSADSSVFATAAATADTSFPIDPTAETSTHTDASAVSPVPGDPLPADTYVPSAATRFSSLLTLINQKATLIQSAFQTPLKPDTQRTAASPLPPPLPHPTRRWTVPRLILLGVGGVTLAALAVVGVMQTRPTANVSKSALLALPCREPSPPDLPSGEPDFSYPNGTRYYGAVTEGLPASGRGTMVFSTGSRYDGEFKNGKRNGCGTYTFVNGRRYVGQFQNDRFEGQGVWFLENGDRYIGAFKDDRCHGKGTFIFKDGKTQSGTWRNGQLEGSDLSCDR